MEAFDGAGALRDTADGVVAFDPSSGEVLAVTEAFRSLLGYDPGNPSGRDVRALGPVDASTDDGVNLSYDASDPVVVTVEATTLDDGTDVVALDDEDGSQLAATTVEDGTMRFDDLPGGEHRVDLAESEADGGGNDGGGNSGGGNTGGDGDPTDGGATDDDRPDVTIRTANVSRTTVQTGETVTVNATFATDGTRAANDTIALRVDDVPVRNETLSLPGGDPDRHADPHLRRPR